MLALFGFGGYELYARNTLGWILIGCAFIPIVIMIWAKYELKFVPIGRGNNINDLLSNECLDRLGHEPHAAHDHGLRIGFCSLLRQSEGIPDKIGDLPDIMRLISMNENADILFLFQPDDLLLHFIGCHDNSSLHELPEQPALIYYTMQQNESQESPPDSAETT